MSDFRALAHLEEQLGEKCWRDLIDSANTGKVKQFLQSLQLLLTPVGTIKVRPEAKFAASEFFQVNINKNASVKISYVGENFTAWFLGKTEERSTTSKAVPGDGPYRTPPDVQEMALRYHHLNRSLADGLIIDQLGGEAKAETTLAEIAACMQKQASGEQGALLNNGYANIFYVCDINEVFRVVFVDWYGDGWNVNALSVGFPGGWGAGRRVFSRDCEL